MSQLKLQLKVLEVKGKSKGRIALNTEKGRAGQDPLYPPGPLAPPPRTKERESEGIDKVSLYKV